MHGEIRQYGISLGTSYFDLIDIGINAVLWKWTGFVKLHLQNLQRNDIGLLKGERAFVMPLLGGKLITCRVRKINRLAF